MECVNAQKYQHKGTGKEFRRKCAKYLRCLPKGNGIIGNFHCLFHIFQYFQSTYNKMNALFLY